MQEKSKFPRPFFSGRTDPPQFIESQGAEIPIRILIQDSQADIREMMASHLTSLGYECKVAETPNDALEILGSGLKLDIACCDLAKWPDEKFWDFGARKTHVVALLALYDAAIIEKFLEVRPFHTRFDFLLKPFTPELLTIVVSRGLDHHRLLMENLFLRNWVGLGSGIEIPRTAYEDHL